MESQAGHRREEAGVMPEPWHCMFEQTARLFEMTGGSLGALWLAVVALARRVRAA